MKKLLKILSSLIIIVLIARLAAPFVLKAYINHTIHQMDGYDGQVGSVSLGLLKGSLGVNDVHIVKTAYKEPTPFFSADAIRLRFHWKPLFHKFLIASLYVDSPRLDYVATPAKEEPKKTKEEKKEERKEKVGEVKQEMRQVRQMPPFRIDAITVDNGEVKYHDYQTKPEVNLKIDNVQAKVVNLTNSTELSDSKDASIDVTGHVPTKGMVNLNMTVNQFAKEPTFKLNGELLDLNLVEWNNLLRAYGKFDVAGGVFNLAMEFAARDGNFKGYIKPTFDDLNLISWNKDKHKPIKLFKKALIGSAAQVLKNQPKDRLGTKVPLSGKFDDPKAGVWPSVGSLLKNAFIKALFPGVEGSIKFSDVKES